MKLSKKARFFQNALKQLVVLDSDGSDVFRGTEAELRKVKVTGHSASTSSGDLLEYEASFHDPRAWVRKRGRCLVLGDGFIRLKRTLFGKYNEVSPIKVSKVLPLPKTRVGRYLFERADGTLIYVDCPEFPDKHSGWGLYNNFCVFLIKDKNITEVKQIGEVVRYRDGGTTKILTELGLLCSPTPFGNDKPTFNCETVKSLGRGAAKRMGRKLRSRI